VTSSTASSRPPAGELAQRSLTGEEKRTLALLGLPTFGLALATTVVTTYLPVLAKQFTGSTAVIGVIIGGEGIMALWLPLVAGTWSDQLRTRLGGRLPFVLAGAPVAALALALMGFVGSLVAMAGVVLVFFAAYYTTYEPYRALYPDLLDEEISGRGQSTQALWRGAGTGGALVGGGLLLSVGKPVPFIAAALLLLAALGAFALGVRRRGVPAQERGEAAGIRDALRGLRRLVSEHPALRAFLFANACWELSLSALKTFIVLYLTVGLGQGITAATGLIAAVAAIILIASPISGKLGDRLGTARVMNVAMWVYGLGLLVPFATRNPWILVPVLPAVAFGGAVILTLPYALLIPIMPREEHGLLTGYYSLSRGLGTMLGPLLAGVAIQLLQAPLHSTQGYGAMWLVCSAAILASIPFLRAFRASEADRAELRG